MNNFHQTSRPSRGGSISWLENPHHKHAVKNGERTGFWSSAGIPAHHKHALVLNVRIQCINCWHATCGLSRTLLRTALEVYHLSWTSFVCCHLHWTQMVSILWPDDKTVFRNEKMSLLRARLNPEEYLSIYFYLSVCFYLFLSLYLFLFFYLFLSLYLFCYRIDDPKGERAQYVLHVMPMSPKTVGWCSSWKQFTFPSTRVPCVPWQTYTNVVLYDTQETRAKGRSGKS